MLNYRLTRKISKFFINLSTHVYIINREWTSQQYAEKHRLADEQRKADHLYDLKAIEMEQRAMEVCQPQ